MELYFHSLVSLAEARFAASTNPVFLGFCFSTHSPNYISPIEYIKIRSWVSGGEKVGQFLYEPIATIQKSLDSLRIEWIEIPSDHPDIEELSKIYKLITTKGESPFSQCSRSKQLLNNEVSTENTFFDIDHIENAVSVIEEKQPFGIALSGGRKESEPGMTDLSKWMDLMEGFDIH